MATAPFAVFVTATLVILAVFAAVARSARGGRTVDYGRVNRLRLQFFVSLAVILLLFLLFTLRRLPYPVEARTPDRIVNAVGKQYAWSLTDGAGPTLASWERDFSPVVKVAAGTTVEFRVTTLDVNHGFSLYGPGRRSGHANTSDAWLRQSAARDVRPDRHLHRAVPRVLRHEPPPHARRGRSPVAGRRARWRRWPPTSISIPPGSRV